MRIIYWTLKIIAFLLMIVPFLLAIPGFLLFILSEEIDTYMYMQEKMEVEIQQLIQQLKKENDGEENIL